MSTATIEWWAENMPIEEARDLLTKAADQHPHGFTNPKEIGINWAIILDKHSYCALPPYARNYLAMVYLKRFDKGMQIRELERVA